jgi:hypothetical protein
MIYTVTKSFGGRDMKEEAGGVFKLLHLYINISGFHEKSGVVKKGFGTFDEDEERVYRKRIFIHFIKT